MKGEFKGSPEELIDYLFKFVKNEEDYAVCTIISSPGEWEFEIDFKDIAFDETSVDPLPKRVIHRLPDNFNADIDFDESLLNERLVLSKTKATDDTLDILDKDKYEDTYKSFLKEFAYSGLPVNFLRNSGFCVATPTGHVFNEQTRIMTQPTATKASEANEYSSAPSSAATAISRPVINLPSVSSVIR